MIEDKDAIASLNKVDKKGKSTGQKFADVAKKGALIGAAVVTGAVAAGGALFGMASNAAGVADNVDKASKRMGIASDAYQELDYWASQNGLSNSDMEKAVGRLNQRMGEAAAGNEKYSSALEKLGVNMDSVREGTVSTEDAFVTSIQSLSEMENGQEQAALASELFGTKLARELLPALQDGSLSIEDAKKQAQDLGIVLGEDAIGAGVLFTDTMDQMKRSLGAVATNVGVEVMPMIQTLLDWVIANMPQIQAVMSTVFGVISSVVSTAVGIFRDYLLPIITNVADYFRDNMPAIQEATSNAFTAIKTAYDDYIKPAFQGLSDFVSDVADKFNIHLLPAITVFYDWISGNMPAIKQFISDTFTTAKEMIGEATDAVKDITKFIQEHWAIFEPILAGVAAAIVTYKLIALAMGLWTAATSLWTTITGIATGVATAFSAAIAFITSPIGLVVIAIGAAIAIGVALYKNWDTISAKASELWSAIKTKFNDIKTAIMNPINDAKDAVSNAIEAMKGFFNFEWKLPKIKMPKFSVSGSANPLNWLKDGVPKLNVNWNAKGGIFDKPTIFNTSAGLQGVGEAGPEAILPLNSTTYAGMGKGIADALSQMIKPQQNDNNNRPLVLQIDGKTFAQITGDYTGAEGGTRIRRIERGLPQT